MVTIIVVLFVILFRVLFVILIIFISIGLVIINSCKDNSTEPEYIDEQLRPFAGTWNALSWLYAEIPMDTLTEPDSSDFILDCGYTFVITVELSRDITVNISAGDNPLGSQSGTIRKKDEDEFILTFEGIADTVTYHFSEDSTTLTYTTINMLDFSPDYRCNLINPNPPNPVLAFLTATLQKQD